LDLALGSALGNGFVTNNTHVPGAVKVAGGVVAAALGWLLIAGLAGASRPGYSPDEELTALAARSTTAAGVPRLPSGAIYLRGVLFVKTAALAGAVASADLATYRLVSLASGLAALLFAALVARRWSGGPSAGVVAVLLAASPVYLAMSVFARPYTAAAAVLLLACLTVERAVRDARAAWLFVAGVAAAQGVHEAGVLVVLVPATLMCTMAPGNPDRRRAGWLVAASGVVAIGLQIASSAAFTASVTRHVGEPAGLLAVVVLRSLPWPPLHVPSLAHPLGLAGVAAAALGLAFWLRRRTRVSWVFLLLATAAAAAFLLGPLIGAVAIAVLARPDRARPYASAGLALAAFSAVAWVAHTVVVTDAALSWRIAAGLLGASLAYSWSWIGHVAGYLPLTTACALLACVGTVLRPTSGRRILAALTCLILFLFGVAGVPVLDRYFLLVMPFLLLLAASTAADADRLAARAAGARTSSGRPAAVLIPAIAILTALVVEQRVYAQRHADPETRRVAGLLPVWVPGTQFGDEASRTCLASLPSSDLLVCNDELACRYLAGRVDAWLLPDPRLRRVLAVERDGVSRGIYAGARVLADDRALARWLDGHTGRGVTLALLDTPKFGYLEQAEIARRVAIERGAAAGACAPSVTVYRFASR
jgi:hypothetical protein